MGSMASHGAPGRAAGTHFVKGTPTRPPWPEGMEEAMFGMGCFWCSENLYMRKDGVFSTQVGYAGGRTPNPTYEQVCTGSTGHNEVCRVVYNPSEVSYDELLRVFWEHHNPTTPNRQGNDCGTQYRSGIYCYSEEQKAIAEDSKGKFQQALAAKGVSAPICTEILFPAPEFHRAEEYHQQYDAKPGTRQYCGLRPTGAKL